MKKYIILMLTVITTHIHSMEMDLWRLPVDTLDLIAQDFSFRDVETIKEFITRTEKLHNTASKNTVQIPQEYATYVPFTNIKHCAYSPNNETIAILEDKSKGDGETFCRYKPLPKLVIIDRKNNQSQMHNFGTQWSTRYSALAVSRDGNLVAAIHSEKDNSRQSRNERMYYKDVVTITNLSTKQTEEHDTSEATIAFNKQGTDIILHHYVYPSIPTIIPIKVNNPATINNTITIDNSDTTVQPHPTLAKYAKYFAQKGICKDLLGQLQEQKMNARKK